MDVQKQYADIFDRLEEHYGLPRGYLNQTAQIESNFNPHSHNEFSGADGLFQFIPSTARAYGLRYGRGPGTTGDPIASAEAAARYAADNQEVLRQTLGRDPTAGELYVTHQQGTRGGNALLANPNVPAGRVVSPRNISLNGGNPQAPAGQFVQHWSSKFRTAMPFTSDDDLIKEMNGNGAPAPKTATAASSNNIASDDDLIKEMTGSPSKTTIPSEDVKAKETANNVEEGMGHYVARKIAEHQGSSLADFGARSGAEFLRGIGDVADTFATGITGAGRQGANALTNAGVISPQTAQPVVNWANRVQGDIAKDYAAYESATAKSPLAPVFRGAGEVAGSAPFIAAAGEAVPAEVATAFKALSQRSPTLARILQGVGIGTTSSALTSSTSDLPLGTQMAIGGALGGGLNATLAPAIGAGAKYIAGKTRNIADMFTDAGHVRTATGILQNENPNISVNPQQIIPGSTPTLAEATGDPHIATIQRNVRDANPAPFVQIEQQNNAARSAWWADHAGSQFDLDAATAQRDNDAQTALKSIFKPGQKVNTQPVLDTIDNILSGPGGERTAVKTTLNGLKKTIEQSGADPEKLYNSARKEIGDLLDKRADSAAGQQSSRELDQVKKELDKAITKAAPGFDQYLSDYSQASSPVDAMRFMQGLNLTDSNGNITLGKVDSAIKQIQKGIKSNDPTHPAKSLDAYNLYALDALHQDLQRQGLTQSGITKGTSTYQRFVTGNKVPGGGAFSKFINPTTLGTGAGYGLGELIAPGYGSVLGMMTGAGAGKVAEDVLARRSGAVQSALTYMMTNPQAFTPRASALRRNNFPIYGVPAAIAGTRQFLPPPSGNSALNSGR